jgi:hypothetical protein
MGRIQERGFAMNGIRFRFFLIAGLLGLLPASLPAVFAQSDTAQISGFVTDATRAVVPGAGVVIRNEATGIKRRTQTNESGYYVVTSVPAGAYTISVEAPGFKTAQKTQNRIYPNIAATIDLSLEVGAPSDRIEVVASTARLQSDTAAAGPGGGARADSEHPVERAQSAVPRPTETGGALRHAGGIQFWSHDRRVCHQWLARQG